MVLGLLCTLGMVLHDFLPLIGWQRMTFVLVRTLEDLSVSRLCYKTLCFSDIERGRIYIKLGKAPYIYFGLLAIWKPILRWVPSRAVSPAWRGRKLLVRLRSSVKVVLRS